VARLRAAGISVELISNNTRTAASLACTTLRAIPLSCGSLRGETRQENYRAATIPSNGLLAVAYSFFGMRPARYA
jgi:hypothetical protein